MGKKKKRNGTPRQRKPEILSHEVVLPPLPDRRAMEKTMADLSRLLEGREFDSQEEVNAFLQQAVKDRKVPETPGETPLSRPRI